MGFFKRNAESIVSDVEKGTEESIGRASKTYLYAVMEGSGTTGENAAAITDAITTARNDRKKKDK
ncbi:hypothetical protein [Streptomyces sp. NPDC048659]|uniref:hypothetical protein n=1 Tax=Streptomyces sp. NPDC048659 TaxID=3155489 RepID=UPI003417B0FF